MAYGIWIKSLDKWLIDGYDHVKNEEIPSESMKQATYGGNE